MFGEGGADQESIVSCLSFCGSIGSEVEQDVSFEGVFELFDLYPAADGHVYIAQQLSDAF